MKYVVALAIAFLGSWLLAIQQPAPFLPSWVDALGGVLLFVVPSWGLSVLSRKLIPGPRGSLVTLAILLACVFLYGELRFGVPSGIHVSIVAVVKTSLVFWSSMFLPFHAVLIAFDFAKSKASHA